jgi:hypothetical protein
MSMKRSEHLRSGRKCQSSFELLITLSVGLAILLPLVIIAFVQLSNASVSAATVESQQAASKLANVASVLGTEGAPAKQFVQIEVPAGVENIYLGNLNNTIGHLIIFVVRAPNGPSYVTEYSPVNISGNIGSLVNPGTYLVNMTAESACPTNTNLFCIYVVPVV